MRPISVNGRLGRAASKAIANRLKSGDGEPIMLWTLSQVADDAARAAGMIRPEMFPSLWDYERLIPADCRVTWLTRNGSDSLACVVPRNKGLIEDAASPSLLLSGPLREARPEELNI